MTQVFDPESGAGHGRDRDRGRPVPGRPGRRRTRPTATRPSSSRSTRSPSGSSRRASSAISRRRASAPHRHLVEFRGQSELQVGESVTVEAFEPGEKVKVAGISIGKGFQGTIKRHNFAPRPGLARLAQRPQAGLDRRVGDPVARLQGPEDGRPDGRRARHPAGPRRSTRSTSSGTCCSSRAPVPGPEERPRRDQGGELMAAPKAKLIGGKSAKDVTLDAEIFGAEVKPHLVHETVRAELNARRAGTRGAKTRGLVAGGRAKPWRQKGTGRARAGTIRAPQFTGGGVVFAPDDAQLRREGEPQGAPLRAPRRALEPRRERHARACSTAPAFEAPVDEAGQEPRRVVGQGRAARARRSTRTRRR